MTSDLDTHGPDGPSAGDRRRARKYAVEFGAAMVGYGVVLALVIAFGDLRGTSPWRFVWALLPVLPILGVAAAVYRHVRRADEYQRGLLLVGLSVGFAAMCAATVTVGLLEIAGLRFEGSSWVVYATGMMSWGVASGVAARRVGC